MINVVFRVDSWFHRFMYTVGWEIFVVNKSLAVFAVVVEPRNLIYALKFLTHGSNEIFTIITTNRENKKSLNNCILHWIRKPWKFSTAKISHPTVHLDTCSVVFFKTTCVLHSHEYWTVWYQAISYIQHFYPLSVTIPVQPGKSLSF